MLRSLAGIGRALATAWPALLAWYLAGQCVRWAAIVVAAPLTADNTLGALLIVPIAVLARLVSYIGMFLALRRAMPGYRLIAGGDVGFASLRDAAREFMSVLLVTIGPFFTLYALLGLLTEDIRTYGNLAFRHAGLGEQTFDASGPLVIAVVVIALGLRLGLRVFGRRLPVGSASSRCISRRLGSWSRSPASRRCSGRPSSGSMTARSWCGSRPRAIG